MEGNFRKVLSDQEKAQKNTISDFKDGIKKIKENDFESHGLGLFKKKKPEEVKAEANSLSTEDLSKIITALATQKTATENASLVNPQPNDAIQRALKEANKV